VRDGRRSASTTRTGRKAGDSRGSVGSLVANFGCSGVFSRSRLSSSRRHRRKLPSFSPSLSQKSRTDRPLPSWRRMVLFQSFSLAGSRRRRRFAGRVPFLGTTGLVQTGLGQGDRTKACNMGFARRILKPILSDREVFGWLGVPDSMNEP
jgi:hypothetical protein